MQATSYVRAVLLAALVGLTLAQDLTMLLQNRKIVEREIGCVLEKNPCDVIGKQIRGLLPEALNNGCRRCTPQQAVNARKLVGFMKQNYPNEWRDIVVRYSKQRA